MRIELTENQARVLLAALQESEIRKLADATGLKIWEVMDARGGLRRKVSEAQDTADAITEAR